MTYKLSRLVASAATPSVALRDAGVVGSKCMLAASQIRSHVMLAIYLPAQHKGLATGGMCMCMNKYVLFG